MWIRKLTSNQLPKNSHAKWFMELASCWYEQLQFWPKGRLDESTKLYDPMLWWYVVVKLLKTVYSGTRERLVKRACAQARIEHPNVCAIYESGEFHGKVYIAMQYINGTTPKASSRKTKLDGKSTNHP